VVLDGYAGRRMLGRCRARLSHFPMTYAKDTGSSESNRAPPRPDPLRGCGQGSPRPSGIMTTTNISLRSEGIQDRAYLSIGVTSGTRAGLCGVPGEGDSKGIGAGICKILQTNFRESQKGEVRRIPIPRISVNKPKLCPATQTYSQTLGSPDL
jgi:hypothetical protein